MPLILAVEPNPLRLAHVTSLTRGRPRTDLLIAESVRAALSAIAARAPDVLLISPEVSAEDRARIIDSLKGHGDAGARVMVFTTPQPAVGREQPLAVPISSAGSTAPAHKSAATTPGVPAVHREWGSFDPRSSGLAVLTKQDNAAALSSSDEVDPVLIKIISY